MADAANEFSAMRIINSIKSTNLTIAVEPNELQNVRTEEVARAPSSLATPGEGVLTFTWYTYIYIYICMCLPFGAPFREILYSDRGSFIRDEGAQIT